MLTRWTLDLVVWLLSLWQVATQGLEVPMTGLGMLRSSLQDMALMGGAGGGGAAAGQQTEDAGQQQQAGALRVPVVVQRMMMSGPSDESRQKLNAAGTQIKTSITSAAGNVCSSSRPRRQQRSCMHAHKALTGLVTGVCAGASAVG